MEELKDRIAAARKLAGLTQEQLGELLGVTRQAVSKWESGQTVPDAVTVARLCKALHVSADYVLLGKEPEESDDQTPPRLHTAGHLSLLRPGCGGFHLPHLRLSSAHGTAPWPAVRSGGHQPILRQCARRRRTDALLRYDPGAGPASAATGILR